MEQSPSGEANRSLSTQEIPCILWKRKIRYRILKSQPPVPILSQTNPVHSLFHTSRRSTLISFSHLRLGSPSALLPSRFPVKTLYASLVSPIRTT